MRGSAVELTCETLLKNPPTEARIKTQTNKQVSVTTMSSVVKMTALLGMTLMLLLMPCFAHKDQTCMECFCFRCYGLLATCCPRFTTYRLTRLQVAVNCSRPDQSRIIDPVNRLSPSVVQNASSACSGYHLLHEDSCLTAMPDNYCKYQATRAVSLSHNNLSTFPDLKCLYLLGSLVLTHNRLTSVPRNAFKGLRHIREIFLDNNEISFIDPLAFEGDEELSIFSVSYNRLLTLEAWPLSLHHVFCVFNFSHNQVHHFSNRGHWMINTSKAVTYGPGLVDFSYNRFEGSPLSELHKYGLDSILQLAKFIRWGFDFRHNPLRCNCKLYPAVKWAERLAMFIWRDYFNVTCASPPHLRGLPIVHLPLDALVCNLTADCPSACSCQDQPAKKATFIFCDHVGLRALPEALPKGNHLVIHMANNSVNSLPPHEYLTRTKRIDLRGSGVKEVEEDTLHLLKKAELVDLRDNHIRHLPSTFQVLAPQVVRLDLHTLHCSCDLDWMPAWLQHGDSHSLDNITCTDKDSNTVLLLNATRQDLCGPKAPVHHVTYYKITMIAALSVVVVLASLVALFRYELFVVTQSCRARRAQRRKKLSPGLLNPPEFHVFISLNVNSDSDTEWVNSVLMPALDDRDMVTYLPLRDCPLGTVEMDELTKRMQDSATALVVLSPDYVQSPSCLFQFKQAYSHMIGLKKGNLLVIRRGGQLSRRSVPEPRLRAMLTLRMFYVADTDSMNEALDALMFLPEAEDTEI